MTKRQIMEKIPFKMLAVFLVLAAAIGAGGYFYYEQQRVKSTDHILADLNTIAQLKSEEITSWRRERYGDAYVLSKSMIFAAALKQSIARPGDVQLRNKLRSRLGTFDIFNNYESIFLVGARRELLLAAEGKHLDKMGQHTQGYITLAADSNKIIFSDFYYCHECQHEHLDIFAPLYDGREYLGCIIFRVNPQKFLYPLLQSWPTSSRSGETTVLHRDEDMVHYVNIPRNFKGKVTDLVLKVSDTLLIASMAVRGRQGTVEGYDYRGVRVVAVIKQIADSPWFMTVKMDKDEIFSPLKRQAKNILSVTTLTIITLAAVLSFFWQAERRGFYKKQYQLELDKQALIKHFDYLTKYANDIIFLLDQDRLIVEINERGVQTYGYRREELLGREADLVWVEGEKKQFRAQMKELMEKGNLIYETVHRRKDGSSFPVEISARVIEIEGKKYLQGIVRNISERKQYELDIQERNQKLGETNRALEALNQCSFELASLPAGIPVYDVLTKHLKEMTGGCAVTFGLYDRKAKEIVVKQILMEKTLLSKVERILGGPLNDVRSPVSPQTYDIMMSEGAGVRYTLNEITFGAVPEPVSSAIGALMGIERYLAIVYQTEGQLYGTSVVALKKGQTEPDHEILKAFGSMGAVSLRRAQAEANLQASHEELQASYREIEANNQELQAAEEELKNQMVELEKSEKRYHSTLDNMMEGCQIIDREFRYIYINDAAARHGRKEISELLGKTMMEAYPGIQDTRLFRILKTCIDDQTPQHFVNEFIYQDGSKGWFDLSLQCVPEGVFILSIDITERKRAEEALRETEARLITLSDNIPNGLVYQIDSGKDGQQRNFTYISAGVEKLHGVTPEKALKDASAIYGQVVKDDRKMLAEREGKALSQMSQFSAEVRIKMPSGAIRWSMFISSPRRLPNGNLVWDGLEVDITEHKQVEMKIIESEQKFRQLAENIDMVFWLTDWTEKILLYVNQAYEKVFGLTVESAYSDRMGWKAAVHPDDLEWVSDKLQRHALNEEFTELEYRIICRGQTKWIHEQAFPLKDETGKVIRFINVADDITERKRNEKLMALQSEVLKVLTTDLSVMQTVERVVEVIKYAAGFDAVGLRLRTGEDYPFVASLGYSEEFLKAENTLTTKYPDGGLCRNEDGTISLECTCGMIVSGKTDPNNPLFTPGGSAWTNNSLPFLDVPPAADPRLHPRNRCIHVGFLSLALIPIRTGEEIVGLLHLADRHSDRFTPESISLFEGIGVSIGVALARKQGEEKIKNQLSELKQWQSVMLDREDRVRWLKDEVNRLLRELGRPEAYGPSA